MVAELAPLDISAMPDLARLADEVRAPGRPRRLRRAGEDIALLIPAHPAPKGRTRTALARAGRGASVAAVGDEKDHAGPGSDTGIAEDAGDLLLKGLTRRRRSGLSVAERTAGALKRYAKNPPATREEEKAAFAQAVAEEVAGRTGA